MHDDAFTLERLARAIRDRIQPAVAVPVAPVDVAAWHVDGEPVPAAAAIPGLDAAAYRADYQPFPVGAPWGRPWGTTWFRLRADVPSQVRDRRTELVVDLG